jgi:hypothetical protein
MSRRTANRRARESRASTGRVVRIQRRVAWLGSSYAVAIIGGAIAAVLAAVILSVGVPFRHGGAHRGALDLANAGIYLSNNPDPRVPWDVLTVAANVGDGPLYGCLAVHQDIDSAGWPLRWNPESDGTPFSLSPGSVKRIVSPASYKPSDFTMSELVEGSDIFIEVWLECDTPRLVSNPWFFRMNLRNDRVRSANPGPGQPFRGGVLTLNRCPTRPFRTQPCHMRKLNLLVSQLYLEGE